ncbi:MAG: hypothetical protein ACREVW_14365, partial [Burkholderiales bacterium]
VGGTCGNVLSILAYLGWEAFPIARMNSDPASQRVKADMQRWGVRLDFAACTPATHTPIIIQEIRRGRDGLPVHRFSWSCRRCGHWLPGFKPVVAKSVEWILPKLDGASVFFMDRLSRAALNMSAASADGGALVVFEPSVRSDGRLLTEALRIAHVVKYAEQRFPELAGVMAKGAATLLEIQTLGATGLRFRHKLGARPSTWQHLPAIAVPALADTCGAGDWCTAGFLAMAAKRGVEGFQMAGVEALGVALRYGQTLASWSCGFEGARGGMYAVERSVFNAQIKSLSSGRRRAQSFEHRPRPRIPTAAVPCPACPL